MLYVINNICDYLNSKLKETETIYTWKNKRATAMPVDTPPILSLIMHTKTLPMKQANILQVMQNVSLALPSVYQPTAKTSF